MSEELVRECASFDDALRLCFRVSGRSIGEVAWDCGWRDAGRTLSRILRDTEGDDQRYMPHKRLKLFMLACRNAVPLWWLMMQLELKPEDAPHFEARDNFIQQFAAEQQECKRLLTEVLVEIKSSEAAYESEATSALSRARLFRPGWFARHLIFPGALEAGS